MHRLLKTTTILLALFLIAQPLFGQEEPIEIPDVIPPSPTSAGLGKYGDVPANLHHGTPNINIPLYEIIVDDIRVPISLSFHASGHKVVEQASWVGLGWSLNAGGVVNRSMRGKPDEDGFFENMPQILEYEDNDMLQYLWKWHRGSYYTASDQLLIRKWESDLAACLDDVIRNINPITNPTEYANAMAFYRQKLEEFEDLRESLEVSYEQPDEYFEIKNWMHNINLQNYDTQADIFRYNYPGGSGKFMFKADQSVVQIPYQDHDIIPNLTVSCGNCTGHLGGFQIVDSNGLRYSFSRRETTEVLYPQDAPVTDPNVYESSWYLSDITSRKSGKSVAFNYSPEYPELADKIISEARVENIRGQALETTPLRISETTIKNTVIYLESIVWEGGSIEFRTDDGRYDRLDGSGKILKEVIIKDKNNNVIKSFLLEYNNGTEDIHTVSGNHLHNHIQLTSVKEVNALGESLPPYEIDYYGSVPNRDSKSIDHHGFFNNIPNTRLHTPFYNYFGAYVEGADRSPGALTARVGMVKRIHYPTGGFTQFNYENHEINNTSLAYTTNTEVIFVESCDAQGVLLPDASFIGLTCENSKIVNVTIPSDAVRSKFSVSSMWGTDNPTIDDPNDFYVRIYDSSNALLFEYSAFSNVYNETILQPGETYRFEVNSTILYTKIDVRIEYDTPLPGPNSTMLGGIRIASIIDYADDHLGALKVVRRKDYEYINRALGGVSSGFSLVRTQPDYSSDLYRYIKWSTGVYRYRTHSSSGNGTFEVFGGGQVVYTEVREKQAGNGYTDYIYSNQRDDSDVNLMELPFNSATRIEDYPKSMTLSSSAWKRGHLLEKKIFNESGELKSWVKNDYEYIVVDSTKSFSYQLIYDDLPPSQIFTWSVDTQNSGWAKLVSTTTKTYEDGLENAVSVTNIYDTDDKFILPRVREHHLGDPDNGSPIDYSEEFDYLNNRTLHIINPVTRISRFDDEALLLNENIYSYDNNGRLERVEKLFGSNSSPEYTTELSQFNGLKPSYVQDNSGVDVVYLWGYGGTLPIARISNVTYDEISTSLGADLATLEGSFDSAWIKTRLTALQNSLSTLKSMTIYLHQQGVGLMESIDENGRSTFYQYDDFNRLLNVKDHEGNYLQHYEYNYAND